MILLFILCILIMSSFFWLIEYHVYIYFFSIIAALVLLKFNFNSSFFLFLFFSLFWGLIVCFYIFNFFSEYSYLIEYFK